MIQNKPAGGTPLQPQFPKTLVDRDQARATLEALRWPHGVVCPHCGARDRSRRIRSGQAQAGRAAREGLWKCGGCRRQFTVTVASPLENSKLAPEKWLLAFELLCRHPQGISSRDLSHELQLTRKSALAMSRRISHALEIDPLRALWRASARARAAELAARGRSSREFQQVQRILAVFRTRTAGKSSRLGHAGGIRKLPALSLWPMNPHEALAAFLCVNPRSMPGE